MTCSDRILFVTAFLPYPGIHAGHNRIFKNLSFAAAAYNTTLYVYSETQPGSDYEAFLRDMGIDIIYRKSGFSLIDTVIKGDYSFVLFERAYGAAEEEIIKIKKCSDVKILFDCHRLKFLESEQRNSLSMTPMAPDFKEKVISVLKLADIVICISEHEKNILLKDMDKDIRVLPSGFKIPQKPVGIKHRHGIGFIGYMSNIQNIDAVKYFIDKIFPIVMKRVPQEQFYIIGSNPTDDILEMEDSNIKVTGWVKDTYSYLSSLRLSVVPLRIGSGVKDKFIESFACACPVVSTSIGAEGINIENGVTAFIEDDPNAFAERVIDLLEKDHIWQAMSSESYRTAVSKYDISLMRSGLLAILGDK